MSKMGLHDPFGHFKHKLWPKEGRESNWQFDSRPLKVRNHLDLFACRWRASGVPHIVGNLSMKVIIFLHTSFQL
jgi:hypothetical protein